MKNFLLFIFPLVIAGLIFFGVIFYLDKNAGKGGLQITSEPNSKIYLDGKLVDTTPFCECDANDKLLSVGDYDLKLVPVSGNFKPFEETITVNKATLTAVDRTFSDKGDGSTSIISLVPLSDKNGTEISITSNPQKANVFLDSNPVGITPLLLNNISVSDHDLRVTSAGYEDKTVKIRTTKGYRLTASLSLGINSNLQVTPTASPEAKTDELTKVTILDTPTGFLRVRKESTTASSEIAKVNPGEVYDLLEEKEGWFKIKINLPNGETEEGWISSSYASKQEGN